MNGSLPESHWIEVLGCKVNQYDARQIARLLGHYGLVAAKAPQEADLVVVHTCGVTTEAARKSRQTIRRLGREAPTARIIVTGCAAYEEMTRIDEPPVLRIPAGSDWLERLAKQLDLLFGASGLGSGVETDTFLLSDFGDTTRAFLKVQDGCDIGCSYCIIPQLRRAPRDKTLENAVREATMLTQAGYREIVVTGVSVGLYGRDSGSSLAVLLERLAQIPGIGRIRLSSLHPGELTDELLAVWAGSPGIMPHLHLSLQSGSDAVLHAMRRGYDTEGYFDAVSRARRVLNNPAFTTDVIVGFPGETEAHFEETMAFCRKVGFSAMHIFTYSRRPKTIAARMGNQVDGAIATARSEVLQRLGAAMALEYHRGFVGSRVRVLVEQVRDGIAKGYSEHYVPVEFPTGDNLRRSVVAVDIKEAFENHISGINSL